MKKYPEHVLANLRWYAEHRHDFDFSGSKDYFLKKVHVYRRKVNTNDEFEFTNELSFPSFEAAFGVCGSTLPNTPPGKEAIYEYRLEAVTEDCVIHDKHGVDAVEAFIQIDSYGVAKPTRHPTLLFNMLRAKASLNLHIQMYAQDRANGRLPKPLFDELAIEYKFIPWMCEAVENQKIKWY